MVKKEKSFLENAMPDMDMCFLLLVCFIIVATIAVLCMSRKNVPEKYELNCKKNFCKATRPVARKTCPNLEQLHKEYISGQNTENSNLVRQPMPKWPWDKQYSGECKAWSEGVGDYNARGAVVEGFHPSDDCEENVAGTECEGTCFEPGKVCDFGPHPADGCGCR